MDAKITLSFDKEVIGKAKKFAEAQNISLSRMMEFLLRQITSGNYTNLEKWINILSYYRLKTLSHEFLGFSNEFLMLSKHYFRTNKYFKSAMLLIIYFNHKIRLHLSNIKPKSKNK